MRLNIDANYLLILCKRCLTRTATITMMRVMRIMVIINSIFFRTWKLLSLTWSHKGAYETKHQCESFIKLPIASISVQKVSNQNSNYNYDESYDDSGNNEFHIFRKWKSLSLTCSHKSAYETEH